MTIVAHVDCMRVRSDAICDAFNEAVRVREFEVIYKTLESAYFLSWGSSRGPRKVPGLRGIALFKKRSLRIDMRSTTLQVAQNRKRIALETYICSRSQS